MANLTDEQKQAIESKAKEKRKSFGRTGKKKRITNKTYTTLSAEQLQRFKN